MENKSHIKDYIRTFFLWGFFHDGAYDRAKKTVKADGYVIVGMFGIIQAILWLTLATILYMVVIIPQLQEVGATATKVLDNANFTYISVVDGKLDTDIKPQIFTYFVQESSTFQYAVVIDNTGAMNPFFWDDRVSLSKITRIDGVGFMKDKVLIKKRHSRLEIPYSYLFKGGEVKAYKSDIDGVIKEMFSQKQLAMNWFFLMPILFILFFVFGIAGHIIYSALAGFLVSVFALGVTKKWKKVSRIALLTYVQFVYVYMLGFTLLVVFFPLHYVSSAAVVLALLLVAVSVYWIAHLLKKDPEHKKEFTVVEIQKEAQESTSVKEKNSAVRAKKKLPKTKDVKHASSKK